MALPGFSAEMSLGDVGCQHHHHVAVASDGSPTDGHVAPQVKVCTPCIQVGGSPYCVNLLGKKICLPALGRWKGCCRTTWSPPFVR